MRCLSLLILAALASGCAAHPDHSDTKRAKANAMIFARLMVIENGTLVPKGQAQLVDHGDGMRLYIDMEKRPDNLFGEVGMHIHAIGKCDAPDFSSAGPHWNPSSKQHGKANPLGHHSGDLGNINVQFGTSIREMRDISGYRIQDLMDADGAAIVIHEKADDNLTDPSGNSGKRMVCGVFERP